MSPGARIDYKSLMQINPEAARIAVLEYLMTIDDNKAGLTTSVLAGMQPPART